MKRDNPFLTHSRTGSTKAGPQTARLVQCLVSPENHGHYPENERCPYCAPPKTEATIDIKVEGPTLEEMQAWVARMLSVPARLTAAPSSTTPPRVAYPYGWARSHIPSQTERTSDGYRMLEGFLLALVQRDYSKLRGLELVGRSGEIYDVGVRGAFPRRAGRWVSHDTMRADVL